jgi:SAM-dependent methyltransferase
MVGPEGRVISTDFAPEMVTFSQQLGDAQGLQNVDYQVLDAQEMDLETDSVDIILCRSALMVMPDPAAALRESRRVIKPGGSLAFSVFTNPVNNPWVTLQMRSFADRGLVTPPPPDAPGMFSLGDPHKIQALATEAGFTEVDIEAVPFTFHWPDADAIWGTVVDINARLGPIVKALPAEEAQSIRTAVIDDYSAYRADDGSYAVPAEAQAVLAR